MDNLARISDKLLTNALTNLTMLLEVQRQNTRAAEELAARMTEMSESANRITAGLIRDIETIRRARDELEVREKQEERHH